MPTNPVNVLIQNLLADLRPDRDAVTDGELLSRFLMNRDNNALAALVRRHAPMVWGVCCRLLYHHHDAEDAFQATFLVLVRKAGDVPAQAVANWLYGVARQTAVRLRATAAKQGRREKQVIDMPESAATEAHDADLREVLDEELSRLPDHSRCVIVLCDLEGMTRKEAARALGIPEGSVASRLARARTMLAKRLTQRGVVFASGLLAVRLAEQIASAGAPAAVLSSAIKAASTYAAGQAAARGAITIKVLTLTETVVKSMLLKKLKMVCAVALVMVLTGGVASWFVPSSDSVLQAQTPEIQTTTNKKLELQRLQGAWKPVAVVSQDESADDKNLLNRTRLIIKEDAFQVVMQCDLEMPIKEKFDAVIMEGQIDFDPEKTPKTMDWRVEKPKLMIPILKVYELDGDKLKIVTGTTFGIGTWDQGIGGTLRPESTKQGVEGTKTVYYQRDKPAKDATKK
jgi:RNA polymerase sigma factor (sigma-70 family)